MISKKELQQRLDTQNKVNETLRKESDLVEEKVNALAKHFGLELKEEEFVDHEGYGLFGVKSIISTRIVVKKINKKKN